MIVKCILIDKEDIKKVDINICDEATITYLLHELNKR